MVSDFFGDIPEFTLTCISTGGPATTVTWTRDPVTVTEGTETVLNNPETAQYTHTLTGNIAGEYTCTVANNKPSNASASIAVAGLLSHFICRAYLSNLVQLPESDVPADVTAEFISATTLRVSWNPPSDGDTVTGYILRYTDRATGQREAIRLDRLTLSSDVTGHGENITVQTLSLNRLPSPESRVEFLLRKYYGCILKIICLSFNNLSPARVSDHPPSECYSC